MYTVYMHISPSGKRYIGITSQKPKARWDSGRGYRRCLKFNRAIQKYGWENIDHKILFEGLTKEEAKAKEIELIALYDATNPKYGYNASIGGDIPVPHSISDQGKENIRKSRLGKKASLETKQKQRLQKLGTHLSEEHKKKIGEASRKTIRTDEWKRKIGLANKNKTNKAVLCVETGCVYKSQQDANKQTGVHFSSICKCCLGKRKTAGGFHWQYI